MNLRGFTILIFLLRGHFFYSLCFVSLRGVGVKSCERCYTIEMKCLFDKPKIYSGEVGDPTPIT